MSTILTGIKPTSNQIHFGNYFSAIDPLLKLQKEHDTIYLMIANLHAFTTIHEPGLLKESSISQAKIYLACGINLKNTILFRQHKVLAHTGLNWILSCFTGFGTLKRMHAFKDSISKGKQDNISAGVFNYPTLMAADILLYNTDFVPVGHDQKQHIEYAKDIAQRFNKTFGKTIKVPKEKIKKDIGKIPGIDGRKMSKSYNNFIGILEDENTILKKTKKMVSDSLPLGTSKNPDECNIYNLLKFFLTKKENTEIRKKYKSGNFTFKEMKELLYEKIIAFVKPIQKKYYQTTDEELELILHTNEQKMNYIANNNLDAIYDAIGF